MDAGASGNQPPGALRPLRRYEVSFFVNFGDDDTRKMYVVYYCPSASTNEGYIYLPGKGETWYSLNTSTIIRSGRDGKWNYAASWWEEFIKPTIARAEAAQNHRS